MLQNIYINKLLRPINSLPTGELNIGSYQSAMCAPCLHLLCVCLHRPTMLRARRQLVIFFFFLPMWNFWTICLAAVLYDNNSTGPKAGIFRKQRNSLTHGCTQSWLKGRDHLLQCQAAAECLYWILKSLKKERERNGGEGQPMYH